MNCESAIDLMLEADLPELRGEGDAGLARHIHTCAGCRAKAGVMLAGQDALAETLNHASARAPAPGAIRLARDRSRRRPWRVALPLALAAGIGALLVFRQPSQLPQMLPPVRGANARLDVRVPAGRAVAVFQTDNPNIFVIWSF